MSNEIQATFSPRAGNVSDTFEIGFSAPSQADPVQITLTELDAWGRGSSHVTEGGANQRIAVFEGQISGGNFSGNVTDPSPVPTPAAGDPALRVRFAGPTSGTVHTLPIPAAAQANENGVFEIGLRVRARVGRRQHTYNMPHPVFLRNFRAGRPVIAFVTGSGGNFFQAADAFWERHADAKLGLTNVTEIREFLRTQADARGFGPWGTVNIVSHGNAVEWIIRLQRSDRNARHLRWWHVQDARQDPALSSSITSQLDSQSRVIIRGCAIGHDQRLLDEIRQLFGGQATVLAPKFLQFYHSGGSSQAPREGFFEHFFFYHKATTPPSDADAAARLARENPSAGLTEDQWLQMLGRRQLNLDGFRGTDGSGRDRHETISWRERRTINGPRDQARDLMDSFDWMGEAESGFDAADPRQNIETTFSDWHWQMSSVREEALGSNSTRFTREFTGHRIRIEVRRELRDAHGTPVRPDPNNTDHYGTSAPSPSPSP